MSSEKVCRDHFHLKNSGDENDQNRAKEHNELKIKVDSMFLTLVSLTEKVEKIIQPPGQPDFNIQAPTDDNKKYKHDDMNLCSVRNHESKAGQKLEDAQLNNISKASNRGKTVIPSKNISDSGPANQRNSPIRMKVEESKEEI